MQIKQVMSEPVAVCTLGNNLSQAAMLMWERDCGVIPIVDDDGRAVAVITDRDICMAAYTQGKLLHEIGVGSVMSKGLVVCHPDDTIEQAEQLMSENQIRRLPVVSQEGRPVGMLSLNDLARAANQAHAKVPLGTNGVRLTATARTLAAVSKLRSTDVSNNGGKVA